MPEIATDGICVRSKSGTFHQTEQYVKFRVAHNTASVQSFHSLLNYVRKYDVIAFNDSDRDELVKKAAATSSSSNGTTGTVHEVEGDRKKFSLPSMDSVCINWVDVYCNGELCKGVISCVSPEHDESVLFYDKQNYAFVEQMPCSMFMSTTNVAEVRLEKGRNEMTYVHRLSGRAISCGMYLYESNERLVVMDIDGTVTISDVRGYFESVYLGVYSYTHAGVAAFLNILGNRKPAGKGLQIMYLTSRPIAHIVQTRALLHGVEELEKVEESTKGKDATINSIKLPPGPLFCNTESTASAAYRELIAKNTVEFKAGVLGRIRDTFKQAQLEEIFYENPFALAFGNKEADMKAYHLAGLPLHRMIFVDTYSCLRPWSHISPSGWLTANATAENRPVLQIEELGGKDENENVKRPQAQNSEIAIMPTHTGGGSGHNDNVSQPASTVSATATAAEDVSDMGVWKEVSEKPGRVNEENDRQPFASYCDKRLVSYVESVLGGEEEEQ